jgi:hypothetical protein
MTMKTEDARRVTADLRARLTATEDRAVLLEGERTEISYQALVERDPKAKKRLAEINQELVLIGHEMEGVRAALQEANRRHEDAKTTEHAEAERRRAREALKLGKEALDLATALDKSAEKLVADAAALRAVMIRLGALGAAPAGVLIDNASRRAMATHLMGSKLQLQHLAPHERRTFLEFAKSWAVQVQAWADHRLGKPEAKQLEQAA